MSKARWFFPTHTENLEIFLSGGLVTCISGFNGAYVTDAMVDYPAGYLPFFSKDNLFAAIEKSQEDDENLTRCIIELDVSQILRQTVYGVVSADGESIRDSKYDELSIDDVREDGKYNTVLFPAPLPIQCFKTVFFESSAIKNDVSKSIERNLGVFPDKFFSLDPKLFKGDKKDNRSLLSDDTRGTHSDSLLLPDRDVSYGKVFSIGGMLALMFYQSKNTELSINYFSECCELERLSSHSSSELELINNYFFSGEEFNDDYAQMYSDLLGILSADNGGVSEVKWSILNYLESPNELSETLKSYAVKMAKRLRDIEDRLIDKTPEEVFTLLKVSYSKNTGQNKILMILSMYFFRDKVETMLKFYHVDFKDIDYILFAMFYGVGCKYIGLPEKIKNIKGLNYYISNRMAEYSHRVDGSNGSVFKKYLPPKFLINNMIKKSSSGNIDGFVDWLSDYLCLDSAEFHAWEVKHKGFACESNSPLRFKEKPKLTSLIDIEEFERQIMVSSIGNDKDIFDYNKIYAHYEKLVK